MPGQYGIDSAAIVARLSFDRVVQCSNDTAGATTIDQTNVAAVIVAAEAELHLHAGPYYAVPLRKSDGVTTPEGIKDLLVDAATIRLMERRVELLSDDGEGKFWARRRTEILDYFRSISEPRAERRLPIPDAVERTVAAEPRGGSAQCESETPQFTAGFMR